MFQYAFFINHFGLSVNSTEVAWDPIPCVNLTVTATGQLGSDPAYFDALFAPDFISSLTQANQATLGEQRCVIL